jgi:hypothetical protein
MTAFLEYENYHNREQMMLYALMLYASKIEKLDGKPQASKLEISVGYESFCDLDYGNEIRLPVIHMSR